MELFSHLNNVQPITKIINAKFPNGYMIVSTMGGELDLPMLPNASRQAHILPNMKHSLVSIGALYDTNYTVTFKIKYVTIVYKDDIIPRGWRNYHNKLWYFPLSFDNEDEQLGDNKNNLMNNVYETPQAKLDMFLHETCFSPVK